IEWIGHHKFPCRARTERVRNGKEHWLVLTRSPVAGLNPIRDNETLVYRRTGADFILHSVAEDFDDDGGQHSDWGRGEKGGDYVFWPVQDPIDPN
ncbi:MAG: hypothetical protein KBE65_18040, partial [Phycisphaerae bacterium]|nr:hypothetical protein [Phycisphaerae bacterium]